MQTHVLKGALFVMITALAASALAAEYLGDGAIEPGEDEAAELARAVQNPVASMISLPFQNNTDFDFGPRNGTLNVTNVQPVWPITLNEDWNLITRTIFPIVSQPSLRHGQDRETGIGDTTFTAFLSPSSPFRGKLIWGAGPVLLAPTASDDRLGADKWGLGPSAVLLAMPGDFVVGSLLSQVWSTGGSGKKDVSVFTWQPFVNYNLPDGWYLTSSPLVTANWEADRSSDEWTVPLGGGIGKIFRIGSLPPMNAQVQGFYNAARPDAVGRANLRLQLQLLFPRRP